MGTVTQYNLANVRDALGGGNPVYMSNYFRGGPYVPANRTISSTAREPGSGYFWSGSPMYRWADTPSQVTKNGTVGPQILLYWAGAIVGNVFTSGATSLTIGSYTYFRGVYQVASGYQNLYSIARTYPSSYQQAINTGVPSSGTIYLSQLYGAENP